MSAHFSTQGKVALVSGASSGIGASTAKRLAEEGFTVIVGYHRGQDRAQEIVASLAGSNHSIMQVDLGAYEQHEKLAQEIDQRYGRLDVLVNSAGYTQKVDHKDIETLTPELFQQILNDNSVGPYSLIRACLPLLSRTGDAAVINVSSVSAFTGLGSNMAYCAAKAAVDTLTISLARAFGPRVRLLSVSPASVDTSFVAGRSQEQMLQKAQKTPLGRIVSPEDVAEAILACVTHLKTATGVRIVIDGGHTLV